MARAVVSAVLTLTGVACLLAVLGNAPITTLGHEQAWYMHSPGRDVVLFVTTVTGMFCRFLSKAIEDRREKVAALREAGKARRRPGIELDRWEIVYPLLFSVITFGAVLTHVKAPGLTFENVLLAFETGFIWQTVTAGKMATKSTQP
jgi:hypothetical protein